MPGTWSALRPSVWPLPKSCEQEGLPVRVIYGPHARLCSARGAHETLCSGRGRPSAPPQEIGNWKPRVCPHSASASRVGKRSTRLTFAPSICGRLALATPQRPRRSLALRQLPVRQNPPGLSRCCGGGPRFFFFWGGSSSTKRTLKLFFSLNFHPLYSSTQRDRTFGKIILRSTPTCDHNFKSRNLLSSCGENKGPGSDLGAGGGEAARGSEAAGVQVESTPRGRQPSTP